MSSARETRRAVMRSRRPGQSLVEFVLVAPMLLLLIFGLVEFARAWNIRHVVTDAAREGARTLVVEKDQALVTTRINTALTGSGLQPAKATVELDGAGGARGAAARVTITYPYELGIARAFLGWAVADAQLTIRSTFVMRNE